MAYHAIALCIAKGYLKCYDTEDIIATFEDAT